jgi:radical SAM protein with 4Fe4S-binding SPASM domain
MKRSNIDSLMSRSSIYYPHRSEFPGLQFLVGDDTRGWRAERNLFKSLNHLELMREKEKIAERLGVHNIKSDQELFKRNYEIPEAHQRKIFSTNKTIEQIAANAGLSKADVETLLNKYFQIGHMEFHPSDICNLNCQGCAYGQGVKALRPPQIVFPFEHLDKLVALGPRSILFSGGGEPTMYRSKGRSLGDLIERIHELMPNTQLALITNGTFIPEGSWKDFLRWVRISIDAATPKIYEIFRGKPFFDSVADNLLRYLETSIPSVGGTFLYSKINISEYLEFVRYFFNKVQKQQPQNLSRLNLSYRPLRQNPNDTGREFPDAISEEDIIKTVGEIVKFAKESPVAERFLREQTNIEAVLGGNLQPAMPFERCYYSQIFHIVRANGDVRPCFVRVLEPDFVLGNIISDPPAAISLNTLYIGARKKQYCDKEGCRQCHTNYIIEQGLLGKIKAVPSVMNDPFI